MGAIGYGEYHPLVPNDTDEHRAKNRRVVFFVKNKPPKFDNGKKAKSENSDETATPTEEPAAAEAPAADASAQAASSRPAAETAIQEPAQVPAESNANIVQTQPHMTRQARNFSPSLHLSVD